MFKIVYGTLGEKCNHRWNSFNEGGDYLRV